MSVQRRLERLEGRVSGADDAGEAQAARERTAALHGDPAACAALHDMYAAIDDADAHGEPLTLREDGAIVVERTGALIVAPEDATLQY